MTQIQSWIETLWNYLSPHLLTITLVSVFFFAGTLLFIPLLLLKIPQNYFIHKKKPPKGPIEGLLWFLRNLLGLLFLLLGIALLFLPGQGILTILAGLFIMDFPGKRSLEIYLLTRKGVKEALNRFREKHHHPPLEFE